VVEVDADGEQHNQDGGGDPVDDQAGRKGRQVIVKSCGSVPSAPDAWGPPDLVFVPFVVGESGGGGAGCERRMFGADGGGNYEVAVPVAGGWAVLVAVVNVPGDLAAWVHPRFVRIDSGHRLTNRPL
jgi:hypothetical protein